MKLASLSDRIKEVGYLYAQGLSTRDIAPIIGMSKSMVVLYLSRSGIPPDKHVRMSAKALGRQSSRKGVKLSDATKAKMSASNTGHTRNTGSIRTPEQRANMSVAGKKRALDPSLRTLGLPALRRLIASKDTTYVWQALRL